MTEPQTKLCVECKNEMPQAAIRCARCRCRQGKLRHIDQLSAVIAVTAAIASGAAAAWSWVQHWREPHKAVLQVTVRGSSSERRDLNFIVSNSGDRPGAVMEASLVMPRQLVASTFAPTIDLQLPPASVIRPGDIISIPVSATSKLPRVARPMESKTQFRVILLIQQAGGRTETMEITFDGVLE